jgi:V/A-type H+-transporting ATPase subunit I
MSFVNISVLNENLTQVLDCITKLGIMHIVDKKEIPSTSGVLKDVDIQPIQDKLTELNNRINVLLDAISINTKYLPVLDEAARESIEINPLHIIEKIESDLSQIETDIESVIKRINQLKDEIRKLDRDSKRLYSLEAHGLDIDNLKNMRFLYLAFGDIPVGVDYHVRLVDSLTRIPCVIIDGDIVGNRQQIIALTITRDKEILSNALEAAYFNKIDIPEEYEGSISEVLDKIELEIWIRREEIAELEAEIRALRRKWRDKLLQLRTTIITNQTVAESMERFGKTESSFFISGWIPSKEFKKLQRELEKINVRGLLMNATDPITAQESEHHSPKVPTKLRHPFFLRPFTGLIKTFDIPRYSAIDPTFFVSLSFLAMFGIMFADVGHGSILFLLGLLGLLLPIPQLKPIRSMLTFLSCCGVASVIMGLMFGSLFGKEGILKPIWFSLEHMEPLQVKRMLSLGIYFGIGMLSLGVSLNIVQSFIRKNFKDAFFGQWGLTSLLAYWVVVYMMITKSQFSWDIIIIIVVLLLPIMLREPVSNLFKKKDQYHEHGEDEHGESVIESGFQIYEVVMAYLANTLSYIRIAAFNLSHAGLMMAAYALTKEMGASNNIFVSLPSDIMSNVFVIMLEGLIVGIQCMRLEYYEFFSKFFAGEGVEYKPLKIS